MRKCFISAVITVMFFGILSTEILAFDNEPKGFRDLKFGSSPTEDMTLISAEGRQPAQYIRLSDKLQLGEADLIVIIYSYYQAQHRKVLVTVGLHFAGEENHLVLDNLCRQKFGDPFQENLESTIWMSFNAAVNLSFRIFKQKGTLLLVDMDRFVKYDAARKESEAREAETDW